MSLNSIETLYRLPERLKSRTQLMKGGPVQKRDFILYWMHRGLRHTENPALDVAIELGNRLGLPILTLIDIQPDYGQLTARHLVFFLEGARSVQKQLIKMGIGCAINVQRSQKPQQALFRTALQAAALVCEDWPMRPHRQALSDLANRLDIPIYKVDAATILPMNKSQHPPKEALEFKINFDEERKRIILQSSLAARPEKTQTEFKLPFEPIGETSISDIIDFSRVDHSTPPLKHITGGMEVAEAKWQLFRRTLIQEYHLNRGSPLKDGTSKLSAYLNFGMISPIKMAREAIAIPGPGAEDFLRGLCIWRDLAFHWSSRQAQPSFNNLPSWAKASLNAQRLTIRPMETDAVKLFRAQSPDPLWNACQRSLLYHGWIHPALRKTWGKMFLEFIADPKEALETALGFNDRLALDGSSPPSILGIFHCFGLFDRPEPTSMPIFGRVTQQSSRHHLGKLNLPRYVNTVCSTVKPKKIAIIGAGPTGLICGRNLDDYGHDIRIFESETSPGGRGRSYVDPNKKDFFFDTGFIDIQIRDERFERTIRPLILSGLIREWVPRTAKLNEQLLPTPIEAIKRWSPCPRMATLIQRIKTPLELRCNHHIDHIRRASSGWFLSHQHGESGPFDELILSLAPTEIKRLLHKRLVPPQFETEITCRLPGLTLMLQLEENPSCPWDLIEFEHPLLARICREDSKPMRPSAKLWRIDVQPSYAARQLTTDEDSLKKSICQSAEGFFRTKLRITHSRLIWWPEAYRDVDFPGSIFRDKQNKLTLTSDCLFGSNFEASYLSGVAAAGRILRE